MYPSSNQILMQKQFYFDTIFSLQTAKNEKYGLACASVDRKIPNLCKGATTILGGWDQKRAAPRC